MAVNTSGGGLEGLECSQRRSMSGADVVEAVLWGRGVKGHCRLDSDCLVFKALSRHERVAFIGFASDYSQDNVLKCTAWIWFCGLEPSPQPNQGSFII